VAGEKLFDDYTGDRVPVIVDRLAGEIRNAQIFVAVPGASSFLYAQATWTRGLPDWIDAHVRAFEVIAGVPHLLAPARCCGTAQKCHNQSLLNVPSTRAR
jgi:transposase